jgi:dTDP-4-dehydrorhamnose 3,5-epimerase
MINESLPQITPMSVANSAIDGLKIITMKQIEEDRGVIREFYRESAFEDTGVEVQNSWKQINATETRQGAIRGLHAESMQKLVAVVYGEAFGVYVDVRPHSPTCGKVVTVKLTKGTQVLVPKGVCNGFQSVNEGTGQYIYCFDTEWSKGMPGYSMNPLDPGLGIEWPIPVTAEDTHLVSRKDASAPSLKEALELAKKNPMS